MKPSISLVSSLTFCLVGSSLQLSPASAQVTADGTTDTTVNPDGDNFIIEQGDRVGDNLFHSFEEFSVPTLGSVAFNNELDIANIFSRVTGGKISDIDGLISANGAANLFLINPNGIIFGENARLNLGGSFFASSADSLLFDGGLEFSASNPTAPPLLEVNIPIGLGFRDNPEGIVNRSFVQNDTGDFVGLEVAPGKNLTLVGGNINFEVGRAIARGGNIELGGLSAAGTVDISYDGSLNFPEGVAQADITLSNATAVDVKGTGGGSITINARNLNLEAGEFGNSFISAGITEDSTSADAQAGDITINATDNVTVDGSSISNQNQVTSGVVGNAGGVTINTGNLNLINGGQVDASTFGQGNTGSVQITATDTIIIDGEDSEGFVSGATTQVIPGAEGNAGGVTITTGSLNLTNGGQVNVNTFGQGNAGSVQINASDTIIIDGETSDGFFVSGASSQVTPGAEGDAGGVTITTDSLFLTNGGIVDASTGGRGNAGDVTVNARESIFISGETDFFRSGLFANAFISSGNGGEVNVFTNQLTIDDGGGIEAGNFDILGEVAPGTGQPGNINIEANSLSLSNRASIEAATQSEVGEAANINLTIAEDIFFKNNSSISARAFKDANGGNVTINANNGSIVAFPNQNNDIIANAQRGNGGNINITTQGIFGLEERPENPFTNDIDASSQFGLQGDFSLNTPENEPSRGLVDLPENVVNPEDLISQNACKQGSQSKFTLTGRGGLPATPEQVHHSDEVEVDLVEPAMGVAAVSKDLPAAEDETKLVPAKGWIRNEKGEVFLVGYDPTASNITPQLENLDWCQPQGDK